MWLRPQARLCWGDGGWSSVSPEAERKRRPSLSSSPAYHIWGVEAPMVSGTRGVPNVFGEGRREGGGEGRA